MLGEWGALGFLYISGVLVAFAYMVWTGFSTKEARADTAEEARANPLGMAVLAVWLVSIFVFLLVALELAPAEWIKVALPTMLLLLPVHFWLDSRARK